MTIRNRLKLIALVPILLLLLLASYFFVTSYINYEKAQALKTALSNNAYLSKSLAEVGKERGLTALYMGSDRITYKDLVEKQRISTDNAMRQLRAKIVTDKGNLIPFLPNLLGENTDLNKQQYQLLLNNISKLSKIRKIADTPNSDFKKVFFDGYTKTLSTPIMQNLLQLNNFALDTEIASLVSTLSQLYTVKENAGLERGFVSYYMTKKASMAFDEIALWDEFKTKANIFDIKQVTNPQLRAELEKVLNNKKSRELLQELAETSSAIQTDVDNGDYAEEAIDWFALQTQKISLFSKAELIVSNALWHKADTYLQKQLSLLAIASAILLLSLILAYLGYSTARDITRNIQELEDVLNKAVADMKESDQYLSADTAHIENIELDTHEGTKEAYKFLETLVETAKEDKQIALQANEAKSLFLANMSHEIRTPLNGIVGFTEILRSTDLDAEQREFLNIIDKSSENLLSIINNILDLSKIESNKIEIENIVFDAAEEFESAVETYAVGAAEKNIDLNFYMDPTISPKLKGDPTKIKEIIINLLSNAIKFTSYGGTINLKIEKVKEDEGTTNPRIKFSIQDNGIGMTKDQQERIFDAFSQADVSVTRKYGGTGLGLTISSQFVELMGGKLELESAKDHGTTFYFSIPLEEVSSTGTNYNQAFTDMTICKYQEDIPTVLDNYLASYFEYFGPEVKHFESVGELKELSDLGICKTFWLDIDKTKQNIIDAVANVDKSKLIIIANVTSRNKIEEMGVSQDNVIFKPVTLTKLKAVLTRTAATTPELVEKALQSQATQFDAKVLVTEDNIINQKLIKRVLEDHGITVDIANNGLEAFEKRRNNNYDLLFMDIQMPVMDGIEATHEILDYEEDEEVPHIPIVALTANALKGDRERFLAEGMDEYITKPIETTELLYVLNKFLSDKAKNSTEAADRSADESISTPEPEIEEIPIITEDEPISVEEVSLDELILNDSNKNKKILIAKKFLLERRILTKVIENLGYDYEIVEDMDELEAKLATGDYDILFSDAELITENLKAHNKDITIVTESNEKNEIETIIKSHRG
ncbi:ATP-binding protein [Sulfurovum sp. ST-21]|uniref:Sensory/regulatory protein RpfC n=1 Tax=Sulfurovum indicum TaxID=2779528 RepID=A0A7M1S7Q9_9BACT|nr:ATP-binding protein [Sulfurovum indicum]QOR62380.1 nitrate- and nitrite sensing domain-containing protein [Sulfurovum indicum]